MDKILINSHAKINLSLDVTSKRPDGYHEVSMIMLQCGLCDNITVEKSDEITLSSNLSFLPNNEKNIAYKAARAFFEYTNIKGGAKIDIVKHIPVGAGLAGGSGNGAAVLIALNRIYDASLTADALCSLGASIGADVPYCIKGGTMLAEGIGEKLTPLAAIPKTPVVIIKPYFSVSTPLVYQKIDSYSITRRPDKELLIDAIENGDIKKLAKNMVNVMEEVTFEMHSVIREIKNDLMQSGAMGALMSGSGPSVFALFENYSDAKKAALPYKGKYFTYVGWTK